MSDPSHPGISTQTRTWAEAGSYRRKTTPRATSSEELSSESESAHAASAHAEDAPPTPTSTPKTEKQYEPRTCRICFDEVQPTFDIPTQTTQFLGRKPRVRYVSDDPELGRLIRPCKCKGSQQYVHEGCLRAWRWASPLDRHFWQCPTCKYEYRLERLTWAKFLGSKVLRAGLTALILALAVFLLGFVADPIIYLWSDPIGSFVETVTGAFDDFDDLKGWIPEEEPNTWSWHFYKGFLSLGLVGFVKSFFAMSPWQWWNFRIGSGMRRGGRGRDRVENISLTLVLIGVVTFLAAVWKAVSVLSTRLLEQASERIIDVQEDDEDVTR